MGNFVKLKQYSDLLELFHSMGLRENLGNLIVFAYDWRLSNVHIASLLAQRVARWKQESGRPEAKFTVVAHSMGGLVAQYYINRLGGDRHIDRLVMLGTPSYGSLKALQMFRGGLDDELNTLIGEARVRKTLLTFPSAYQLLPAYRDCCFVRLNGARQALDVFDVATWRRFGWVRFSDADATMGWRHVERQLRDAKEFGRALRGFESRVAIAKIVSHTQDTAEWMEFDASGREVQVGSARGDGTVIEVSAALGDLRTNVQYVAGMHGALHADEQAKHTIVVQTADPGPQVTLYSAKAAAARLDGLRRANVGVPKPYYRGGETVPITVAVSDAAERPVSGLVVQGEIEGRLATLTEASPGLYRTTLAAPSRQGAYEITIVLRRAAGTAAAMTLREYVEVIP